MLIAYVRSISEIVCEAVGESSHDTIISVDEVSMQLCTLKLHWSDWLPFIKFLYKHVYRENNI